MICNQQRISKNENKIYFINNSALLGTDSCIYKHVYWEMKCSIAFDNKFLTVLPVSHTLTSLLNLFKTLNTSIDLVEMIDLSTNTLCNYLYNG